MDYSESRTEEIDLINYIKVISKRKYLIFAVFLITVIGVGVYTFFINTKVYKVETTLEVGTIKKIEYGMTERYKAIENPIQLMGKIENGIYGEYPGLDAENLKSTNLIEIKIITQDNPEKAQQALNDINKAILTEHEEKINLEKEELEEAIKELEQNIKFLMLRGQQIADLQLELFSLQKQIEYFQPTKVLKEPSISDSLTASRSLYILIAMGLGIFLGVFLAFVKEWWEKNKTRI